MRIIQLEQAGVIVETAAGYRVAIDIGSYTPVEKLADMSADAMLVSHLHRDHFSIPQIQVLAPTTVYLNRECIDLWGDESAKSHIVEVKVGDSRDIGGGVHVTFFEVDHGPNVTTKPKENFGFLLEADGKRLYFGGDIFYPSGINVSTLEVDYALLPVGGFYTFGPAKAVAFAKQFKHIGALLPMHYNMRPEAKDEFLSLAKSAGLAV